MIIVSLKSYSTPEGHTTGRPGMVGGSVGRRGNRSNTMDPRERYRRARWNYADRSSDAVRANLMRQGHTREYAHAMQLQERARFLREWDNSVDNTTYQLFRAHEILLTAGNTERTTAAGWNDMITAARTPEQMRALERTAYDIVNANRESYGLRALAVPDSLQQTAPTINNPELESNVSNPRPDPLRRFDPPTSVGNPGRGSSEHAYSSTYTAPVTNTGSVERPSVTAMDGEVYGGYIYSGMYHTWYRQGGSEEIRITSRLERGIIYNDGDALNAGQHSGDSELAPRISIRVEQPRIEHRDLDAYTNSDDGRFAYDNYTSHAATPAFVRNAGVDVLARAARALSTMTGDEVTGADAAAWIQSTYEFEHASGIKTKVTGIESTDTQITVRGYVTKNGHNVGSYTRTIYCREKRVYHNYFSINSSEQGTGFGAAFYRNTENAYMAAGVKKVMISANIDVGGYAWARMGFDDTGDNLSNFIRGAKDRWVAKNNTLTTFPKINHIWQLAALKDPAGHTIGKETLLGRTWSALKMLDEDDPGFQAGRAYYLESAARNRARR